MKTIRRVLTLTIGAAAGAAATWLLDPDQGARRRRTMVRTAAQRARARGEARRSEAATPSRQRAAHAARMLAATAAAAYRDEQARRDGALAAGSER